MAEHSKIEWTDHTFNPWVGCTKVSPGCDHCYAEARMDHRLKAVQWGPHGERKRTSTAYWREPLKWDRKAAAAGVRHKVFCASLADVFDNQVPAEWRADLWALIRETPHLDWLLLTKRPQNIAKMVPADWGGGYPSVWLGTTVENQPEADRRIPALMMVPARVWFLSCEPLLSMLDLSAHFLNPQGFTETRKWLICGGESGPGARPMHPDWARSLRDQCASAGVPFHFKQWGEWLPAWPIIGDEEDDETTDYVADDGSERVFDVRRTELLVGGGVCLARVGKARAGRMLDGVEHNGTPEVR